MTVIPHRPIVIVAVVACALAGCGRETGDLEIRVIDARTGGPVAGAEVDVGMRSGMTNGQGAVRFHMPAAQYPLAVSHRAFVPLSSSVWVVGHMASGRTVALQPRPDGPQPQPSATPQPQPQPSPGATPVPQPQPSASAAPQERASIYGQVQNMWGGAVKGATIFVESDWGIPYGMATADEKGAYTLGGLVPWREVKVTAIAEGFETRTRYLRPTGRLEVNFSGGYALRPKAVPAPVPSAGAPITISGVVEDTQGRPLSGVVIRAEAYEGATSFSETAIALAGAYRMSVPTGVALRFTASKKDYRPVTFVATLRSDERTVDFTGGRGLDAVPVFEGETEE